MSHSHVGLCGADFGGIFNPHFIMRIVYKIFSLVIFTLHST